MRAAGQLGLPPSTASKLIRDLETHLGAKLIQRTTRKVSITAEGASYYERAARLLADLEAMDAAITQMPARPVGRLRVDVGSVLANLVIIPRLPEFRRRYPGIELHLGVNDRRLDLISEGVDCVIRGGVLPDSSFVARRLCTLTSVTCATPSYLAAHGTPRSPQDLETGHVVVGYFFAQTAKPHALSLERDREHYEFPASPALLVNDSMAHVNSVLAGIGVGQILTVAARAYLDRGELVALFEDYHGPSHEMHVVYPSARNLNSRLRVFVDWLVEVTRGMA